MPRSDDLRTLPPDLPVPVDDGAADHLTGMPVPAVELPSTAGRSVLVSGFTGRTVVFCYPRTGEPDRDSPPGWDDIPGARGCTPQACAFRDLHQEIRGLGAEVFGLSTQTTEYQREMVARLHIPYEVLSDERLELATAMRLPTFAVAGMTLLKRLTLILLDGVVEHVMYPVFPPDRNAADVVAWLSERRPPA
ncbi:MAG TPA: peroxiredoxin [Actinomycetota bacterium]|nr:peroxiredoxin [Actinomycetota bacterium]